MALLKSKEETGNAYVAQVMAINRMLEDIPALTERMDAVSRKFKRIDDAVKMPHVKDGNQKLLFSIFKEMSLEQMDSFAKSLEFHKKEGNFGLAMEEIKKYGKQGAEKYSYGNIMARLDEFEALFPNLEKAVGWMRAAESCRDGLAKIVALEGKQAFPAELQVEARRLEIDAGLRAEFAKTELEAGCWKEAFAVLDTESMTHKKYPLTELVARANYIERTLGEIAALG